MKRFTPLKLPRPRATWGCSLLQALDLGTKLTQWGPRGPGMLCLQGSRSYRGRCPRGISSVDRSAWLGRAPCLCEVTGARWGLLCRPHGSPVSLQCPASLSSPQDTPGQAPNCQHPGLGANIVTCRCAHPHRGHTVPGKCPRLLALQRI